VILGRDENRHHILSDTHILTFFKDKLSEAINALECENYTDAHEDFKKAGEHGEKIAFYS